MENLWNKGRGDFISFSNDERIGNITRSRARHVQEKVGLFLSWIVRTGDCIQEGHKIYQYLFPMMWEPQLIKILLIESAYAFIGAFITVYLSAMAGVGAGGAIMLIAILVTGLIAGFSKRNVLLRCVLYYMFIVLSGFLLYALTTNIHGNM